jgi:hypothetical protein
MESCASVIGWNPGCSPSGSDPGQDFAEVKITPTWDTSRGEIVALRASLSVFSRPVMLPPRSTPESARDRRSDYPLPLGQSPSKLWIR